MDTFESVSVVFCECFQKFFLFLDTIELVHEALESEPYPFSSKEFPVHYLVSAKLNSVPNRVYFNLLFSEDEFLSETELTEWFYRCENCFFIPEEDDIVHVSDGSNLSRMLQELVEIVQIEVREELGKDTADGDSLRSFFSVERTSGEESVIPIVRGIAVDNAIDGTEQSIIICVFSDFLFQESMIDGEEIFGEINLAVVRILFRVFLCRGDKEFAEILDCFV